MNILRNVTSSVVDQGFHTLNAMGLQDPRIGKIVAGVCLTASGIGLVVASGIPKTLKSWYWTNNQEKITPNNSEKNSNPKAWQWGVATAGLVATGCGVYAIASGILELTTLNDTDEPYDSKPSNTNLSDCNIDIDLLETQEKLLSCPEARKLWEDVRSCGEFSIYRVTTDQTPVESLVSFKDRVIALSERSPDKVKPLLNELCNLKFTNAFSSINQRQCCSDADDYAISIEKTIYEVAKEIHKISESCVNGGYWPNHLKQYEEEFRYEWTTLEKFLAHQELYAPTDWHRAEWYKACDPQKLSNWLISNKEKWRSMLAHTLTPEKIQILLNMVRNEEL